MVKVSVIIPVYKVEKYIERCVRSLFEQSLEDIEFIFVNDCTPDRSMEILNWILQDYPLRQRAVKCLEHLSNQGSATARNTGLRASSGCYIAYCDGDDWVEKNMYEKLYQEAVRSDADIVGCDFYYEYKDRSVYCKQNFELGREELLRSLLRGDQNMGGYSPCRLVRKELYFHYHIKFPDGVCMLEDLLTSFKLHWVARKVAYVPEGLYHYIQFNSCSVVMSVNKKQLEDIQKICRMLKQYLTDQGIWNTFYQEFMERAFLGKMSLITVPALRDYESWRSLWPESNRYVWKYHLSFFNKLVFSLARYGRFRCAIEILKIKSFVKN